MAASHHRADVDVVPQLQALYAANARLFYDTAAPSTSRPPEMREQVSFIGHALQAARHARASGDREAEVASLLHDVGWIIEHRPGHDADVLTSHDKRVQLAKHDTLGANYLRDLGFPERVAKLVEGHVRAKRYLCYKEADYEAKLSAASTFTLQHQGGRMTAEEAQAFEADPDFQLQCDMRRWDEAAKEADDDATAEQLVARMAAFSDTLAACLDSALFEPRPQFDAKKIVTAEMRRQLKEDGYVVLKRAQWLTAHEAHALAAFAEDAKTDAHAFLSMEVVRASADVDADVAATRTVCARAENVRHCPTKRVGPRLLAGDRLKSICKELRQWKADATIFKDKINYKYPGGSGGYFAHQDAYFKLWRTEDGKAMAGGMLGEEDVCVCMMAVDAADEANGCPEIAPGLHKLGWAGIGLPSEDQGARKQVFESEYGTVVEELQNPHTKQTLSMAIVAAKHACAPDRAGLKRKEPAGDAQEQAGDAVLDPSAIKYKPLRMGTGDVLIYGNFMPHRSAPNTHESRPRRALFAIYAPRDAFPSPEDSVLKGEEEAADIYYEWEAQYRRKDNGKGIGGKPNIYFDGVATVVE